VIDGAASFKTVKTFTQGEPPCPKTTQKLILLSATHLWR